jgi:hypothetical protein
MPLSTGEKLADIVSKEFRESDEFADAVRKLGERVCDDLIYNLASELGFEARKKLGVSFRDEDDEFEFGVCIEGDLREALLDGLLKYIKEY